MSAYAERLRITAEFHEHERPHLEKLLFGRLERRLAHWRPDQVELLLSVTDRDAPPQRTVLECWIARTPAAADRRRSPLTRCRPGPVGVAGFEPATPCSQSRCATWLRHTPGRGRVGAGSSSADGRPARAYPPPPRAAPSVRDVASLRTARP